MKARILTLLLTMLLVSCNSSQSDSTHSDVVQSANPPNILWIYIEDQNAWNNAWGDYTVETPNVKSFADSGVKFTNIHQPAPVCSATRSALVTGKYQTTLGVHQHRSFRSEYNAHFLPKDHKTVPELFIEAGYKTFNIGKDDYNFKYDRSRIYNAHKGFSGFQGAYDGEDFNWAKDLKNTPFFGQIQLKGGKHNKFAGKPVPEVDPAAMDIPPYYFDGPATRKEWAKHYQTQVMSDIELKDILNDLKANGILENTAVFWFSDHGMGLLRHKQDLYEDGVKVPLIVNWPKGQAMLEKKGKSRSDLASGLDITATSLALAGIAIPDYYDGKNLFADDYHGHDYVISAKDRMDFSFDRGRTVRTDNFRYIRNFTPEIPRAQPQFRDKKPFSLEYHQAFKNGLLTPIQAEYFDPRKPQEELYHLASDPHQIHNLANDPRYQDELASHRTMLQNWIDETDDKGAYPESELAIKETLDMWGSSCVSDACKEYRQKHQDTLLVPGAKLYPAAHWPAYMPKPKDAYFEKMENIYREKFQ